MEEATKIQKSLQIEQDYINGNLSDFRKGLKSLSKLHLAKFIEYARVDCETIPIRNVVKHLGL